MLWGSVCRGGVFPQPMMAHVVFTHVGLLGVLYHKGESRQGVQTAGRARSRASGSELLLLLFALKHFEIFNFAILLYYSLRFFFGDGTPKNVRDLSFEFLIFSTPAAFVACRMEFSRNIIVVVMSTLPPKKNWPRSAPA